MFMRRVITLIFTLSCLVVCAGRPESLTLKTGELSVRLDAGKCYFMNRIEYQNRQLSLDTPAAHYGTVFALTGAGGFVGSGHRETGNAEQVQFLTIVADGKTVPESTASVTGKHIRMTKISRMRDFTLRYELVLDGTTIRERSEVTAAKDSKLDSMYHFMHPWSMNFTEYSAGTITREELHGVFTSDGKFPVRRHMPYVALRNPASATGVVAVHLPGAGTLRPNRFLWDTKYYRKGYCVDFEKALFPAGHRAVYESIIGFFDAADPVAWRKRAAQRAAELAPGAVPPHSIRISDIGQSSSQTAPLLPGERYPAVSKSNAESFTSLLFEPDFRPEPGKEYQFSLDYEVMARSYGAVGSLQLTMLDNAGKRISIVNEPHQLLRHTRPDTPNIATLTVRAPEKCRAIRVEYRLGGDRCTVKVLHLAIKPRHTEPRFMGIYGDRDPEAPREKTLAALRKVKPSQARVVRDGQRNYLEIDNMRVPFVAYGGSWDFKAFGQMDVPLVLLRRGTNLFAGFPWDKACAQADGSFDFSSLENNLLRVHAANPRARVIVTVNCDPDIEWCEKNPDSIFRAPDGTRARTRHVAFGGFSNAPLKSGERWAHTYASAEYQQYVVRGLQAMGRFLKSSPAGNIVGGFKIVGGHDGQFVQWQYGAQQGHQDYSPASLRAFRDYLRQKYPTEKALQTNWGDKSVNFANAQFCSVAEFNSRNVFPDRPGLGRKVGDSREFQSVAVAAMLRRFVTAIKTEFARPAIGQVYYSSAIWRQVSRLALDELLQSGAINAVTMVTNYIPYRYEGASGGTGNFCIGSLNLRNVIYMQELDHRTYRSMDREMPICGTAMTAEGFRAQILRDVAATLATGGNGFYFCDMVGSWFNEPALLATVRESLAMARHADRVGRNIHADAAVFLDERAKFFNDGIADDNAMTAFRESGFTPDIYHLSDIKRDDLPGYKLYCILSPQNVTRAERDAIRAKAFAPGKVLLISGPVAWCSPDLQDEKDFFTPFGLSVSPLAGTVPADARYIATTDPLGRNLPLRLGMEHILRYDSFVVARTDRRAEIGDGVVLAQWQRDRRTAAAVKRTPAGTIIYSAPLAGLTPQLLHNAAAEAGVRPLADTTANAFYAGYGVAAVHRLEPGKISVDFGPRAVPRRAELNPEFRQTEVLLYNQSDAADNGSAKKGMQP